MPVLPQVERPEKARKGLNGEAGIHISKGEMT
jgi:hypothetical protein